MDQIYAGAQITIIAAAGEDPNYGLPGVGSRPRYVDRHVRFGNTKLVQLMRPGIDFPKSAWWKRAWTYQEGVLCKRKLVFTDHQVFFLCNLMHLAESMNMDLEYNHDVDVSAFSDPVSFGEMVLPTGPRNYTTYLGDISRRSLSYPTDALNVCLGILKATDTTHVWGVPIWAQYHAMALCWHHNVPASRRHIFPSWSWADWDGGVDFGTSITTSSSVAIHLGDDDQNWQPIHEYISSGQAEEAAGKPEAPRLLKMTGLVLEAASLNTQWPDVTDLGTGSVTQEDNRPRPRFSLTIEGKPVLTELYMDQKMQTVQQLHDVVAIGVKTDCEDCCISALLLKPHGQFYSRVGMVKLSCEDRTCKSCPGGHVFWKQGTRTRTLIVE
jgi:hypothetical protein